MKQCTKCKVFKPLEMFSKNRRSPDNYQHHCKPCHSSYNSGTKRRKTANRQKWERENPKAHRANEVVNRALANGEIFKTPCEVCGQVKFVRAHHESYEPDHHLMVNWLCQEHHDERHRQIRIDAFNKKLGIKQFKN